MPRLSTAAKHLSTTLRELDGDDGLPFVSMLPGAALESALTRHAVDFRDRVFPPDITLAAFCSQLISLSRACRGAVARTNVERRRRGLRACSSSTSGYCQARRRLPLALIEELARDSGHALEAGVPERWLWKGRRVKLLDGTTVSMPDTPENQERWPQNPAQRPGLGFPIMRVVCLMSLATAAIIDLSFGPYAGDKTGEQALARQLFSRLDRGDIVLADRAFAGYFLIALARERGADLITRLHQARRVDFRRGKRLGRGDHVIELVKPPRPKWMDEATYKRMPETLELREVDSGATDRDGKKITVVTTLTDPKRYSRTELAAASKMRWNIELDLRAIKTVMGMDILVCKTPEMITKELWAYVLTYNLVRQIIVASAKRAEVEPRQISFTAALQHFQAFAPALSWCSPEEGRRLYETMLDLIATCRVADRPDRREPRAVKRRKKVRLLTEPRAAARKHRT